MARKSALHPHVLDHVARLGNHLNWHGAMHSEYFLDPMTGQPSFIEANPRIGETVNATLSGNNLCEALLRVSLDEAPPPRKASAVGVPQSRRLHEPARHCERGHGRRALLAELLRAALGLGVYRGSEDELTRPRDDTGAACRPRR